MTATAVPARPGFLAYVRERLVFKAYEIEELADRWFFRPAGAVVAYLAYLTPISPNGLTILGGLVGVAAASLAYFPGKAWSCFAGLILHSVIDSADGQLARLRGQMSVEGRILDGLAGYAVFTTLYLAIGLGHVAAGGSAWIFLPVVLAGLSHACQASMYDYYRNQYIDYGIKGRLPSRETPDPVTGWGRALSFAYGDYDVLQRFLARPHVRLEAELKRRFPSGTLSPEAAAAYRRRNYWMVRGWNVFGDNTRFYVVALCAWLGRMEAFLVASLVVLNAVFILLCAVQAVQDARLSREL